MVRLVHKGCRMSGMNAYAAVAGCRPETISAWRCVGEAIATLADPAMYEVRGCVDAVSCAEGMDGITSEVNDLGCIGQAANAAARDA